MNRMLNPSSVDLAPAQPNPDPTPSSTPSIDWNLVHFDVGCARCGHDLRGLTEPKCPACSLEFDWADAVPVERLTCAKCGYHLCGLQEKRCPECGEAFTWEGALAAYHRNRQPYFEVQWRHHPFRAFAASCRGACRPNRFWRQARLHDNASPFGLGLLSFAGLAVATFFPVLVAVVGGWLVTLAGALGTTGANTRYTYGPWGIDCLPELTNWLIRYTVLVGGLGVGASWGALLVLWQSMRACRVLPRHSLRAVAYAYLPLIVLPLLPLGFWFVQDVCRMFRSISWIAEDMESFVYRGLDEALVALALVSWLWVVRSIALAYRHCIRMPHAWGVAIASQVIAGIVMVIAACLLAHLAS